MPSKCSRRHVETVFGIWKISANENQITKIIVFLNRIIVKLKNKLEPFIKVRCLKKKLSVLVKQNLKVFACRFWKQLSRNKK